MDSLEPLERMFQKVEEDSERRAREETFFLREVEVTGMRTNGTELLTADGAKNRRRGSISISRLGQLAVDASKPRSTHTLSPVAPQPGFYMMQASSDSTKSFVTVASAYANDEGAYMEDTNRVTRVTEFAGRRSLSKTFFSLISGRLDRTSSSGTLLGGSNMLIGVSIEEATVDAADGSDASRTVVHVPDALRDQHTITTPSGWVTKKAKVVAQKFRRKSRQSIEPELSSSS